MKTQIKHEESGCVDYLQHSWQSCPLNVQRGTWQAEQRDTAQAKDLSLSLIHSRTVSRETGEAQLAANANAEAYDQKYDECERIRAHAERLAEVIRDLLGDVTTTNEPFKSAIVRQSNVKKLREALAAWEGAQK